MKSIILNNTELDLTKLDLTELDLPELDLPELGKKIVKNVMPIKKAADDAPTAIAYEPPWERAIPDLPLSGIEILVRQRRDAAVAAKDGDAAFAAEIEIQKLDYARHTLAAAYAARDALSAPDGTGKDAAGGETNKKKTTLEQVVSNANGS